MPNVEDILKLARSIKSNQRKKATPKKAGSKKKKSSDVKKDPLYEQSGRHIDEVIQQARGMKNEGSNNAALSSDKKLTLPNARRYNPLTKAPVEIKKTTEYFGNSGRTKEELDRVRSVQEISKTTPEEWLDINMEGVAARNRRAGVGAMVDNTTGGTFNFGAESSETKMVNTADAMIANWDRIADADKVSSAEYILQAYGFNDQTRDLWMDTYKQASTEDKLKMLETAVYVSGQSDEVKDMQKILYDAPDLGTTKADVSPEAIGERADRALYSSLVRDAKTYEEQQHLIDDYVDKHYTTGKAVKYRAASAVSSWWTRLYDAGSMAFTEWLKQGQNEDLMGNPADRFARWDSAEGFGQLAAMVGSDLLYDLFTAAGLPVALLSKIALTPEDVALIEEKLTSVTEPLQEEIARQQRIYESADLSAMERFGMDAMGAIIEMIPGIAMGVVNPAAGLATFGVGAGGASARQAYEQGATLEDAVKFGLSSGTAEIITERMFGGLPFFGKGIVDEVAKKTGAKLITDTTKKALQDSGFMDSMRYRVLKRFATMGGEATEEAIMEIVAPYLERASFNPDAANASLADIGYSAGIGAVVGGILGIPVMVAEGAQAASEKKNFNELTSAVRAEKTAQLQEAVAAGNITAEEAEATIAEMNDIFAGRGSLNVPSSRREEKITGEALDTVYDSYEQARDAMQKEARTKADGEKITANYIENGDVKTFTTTAKGGTLGLGRSGLAAPKYQKIAQAKNITERSGYQLGVREDVINEVSALSQAIGKEVEFYYGESQSDHGFVDEKTGKIYVNANSSQSPARAVIAHEMTHMLEKSGYWKDLARLVQKEYGSSYTSRRQERIDTYKAAGRPLDETKNADGFDEVDTEVIAMFVEEKLLTDEAVVREIVQTDKTVAQKIIDWLNKVIQKLVGNKEQKVLVDARALWQRALEEENKKAPSEKQKKRFSFGGEKAKTADLGALETAKNMLADNRSADDIFHETGWFVGADGKWRFEIANDDLELKIVGFVSRKDAFIELGDLIDSEKLFSAYPDLAWLSVELKDIENGYAGAYDPNFDSIEISYNLFTDREAFKNVLVHEIQHAIQRRESFAHGTSEEYWQRQIENGYDNRRKEDIEEEERLQEKYDKVREDNYELFRDVTDLIASAPQVPRGEINWETWEQIEEDPIEWQEFDSRRDELEEKYGDAMFEFWSIVDDLDFVRKRERRTPKDLYRSTAGEIEARSAAERRKMTEAERRESFPMNRFEYRDVVFAGRETKNRAPEVKARDMRMSIGLDLTEDERYELLKNKKITVYADNRSVNYEEEIGMLEDLPGKAKSKAEKVIYPLAEKLGILNKSMRTPDIEIDFIFSKTGGLKESLSKQISYGGSYADFAKALINLDKIIQTAVQIEEHLDKYKGTVRENRQLERVYVLFGAFSDGEFIIPVQMEVKKQTNVGGGLYMTVAMTKIKAGVLGRAVDYSQASLPDTSFVCSIADIFRNVNPLDADFLKYVPNGFLSEEQISAKRKALEKEKQRIAGYAKRMSVGSSINSAYLDAVNRGDMETAQRMVDEAAKAAGYDVRAYHGTPERRKFNRFGDLTDEDWTVFDSTKSTADNTDGSANYFTNNKKLASFYAKEFKEGGKPKIIDSFLDLGRCLEVDCNGNKWYDIPTPKEIESHYESADTKYISNKAKKLGYDSVHFKNIYDGDPENKDLFGDVYAVFNSNQIKSADPVTYDDEGNVIPLSERFNEEDDDIRWSVGSDAEYMEAVENDDMGTAERIIREAAVAAGYDSPKLHHGTKGFGFTKLRTSDLEDFDWSPFFATNDDRIAETYSGKTETRKISDSTALNVDSISDKDLIKLVRERIDSEYMLATKEDRASAIDSLRNELRMVHDDAGELASKTGMLRRDPVGFRAAVNAVKAELREMLQAETSEELDAAYKAYGSAVDELENNHRMTAKDMDRIVPGYIHSDVRELKRMLDNEVLYLRYIEDIAEEFLTPAEARLKLNVQSGIYELYANTDNLLEIDAKGENWNNIPGKHIEKEGNVNTRAVAKYANEKGYAGVLIRNLVDSGGQVSYFEPADIYIFFDPAAQVKSADTVTYDDNGDIIPPSERFDEGNKDIRWSVGNPEARNYLVGDTVSYLNERATVVVRSNPPGGTMTYTIELDSGERIEVTPDQLQVGVTPSFTYEELPDDVQDEWQDVPDDWDGAYADLDSLEPPKSTDKTNPLELDDVRHMLSDYADMLSDPTAEELEFEWAWTKQLTGKGVSFLKDYVRNIEAAARGSKELEHRLRTLFIDPFRKGKSKYVSGVHSMLDELYDKMEELGIKKDSAEAAAVIKYGEKKKIEWEFGYDKEERRKYWQTKVTRYGLEDLKKDCPNTWENVVEADRWFRDKYDSYLVKINEVRREIYGHHFKHREMEISTAREKAAYHKETRNTLQAQLYDIEQCLRAKRARLAVKRNAENSDVFELEKEIDYNNEYRNTIVNLIAEHEEKEAHYMTLANELEDDLLHGQSWNQKRLKARDDYYHHMREESGFLEDLFLNGRNSEIDPTLEGKSVGTKPKAKWSGIFERQELDPFRYDAVAAFIDYVQAAEYAIHMDPVISQFRANIYNMASATQESKNANKLILWLTNWTNDLSGKTTDHIDRFVQERLGRDNMRKIRKIVSRSKFNAVGINLNSAVAQFGNLPNALAYVQNPESWGKGLQLYLKWLTKDDDARRIVNESTFLDERYLDTVMSKFDQRLKDKPEKFASWLLRFGDQHSSFMIWCVAYEDAVRQGKKHPTQIADEITMEAVGGRGIGEMPLQMRSTWTNIVAPFQVEVNNAYQIYKKKVKTIAGRKTAKDDRVNAAYSFLLLLLGNFVMNTISDLLTHRRVLFDPIFVLLETIGEWADEDEKPEDEQTTWWEKFRDLIGREIGNVFSNMPYGDLLAYYIFNNEWAREKLFGDYDPTRFGVGNIVLDWGAGFATDLVTGGDLADDILGFITTFVTPYGGKQAERIIKGLVQAGWLPDIDISTGELPSVKFQKAPGYYNSKDQLQFPLPTLADDPYQALMAIIFGAYTTKYGEQYLGKDRENAKWWENILGWNKIKEQTALSDRATQVYNNLVANGSDQFAVYDAIRAIQAADTTVEKRNALLDADLSDEETVNILLGYLTQKNSVESTAAKVTAFEGAGLTVKDYLEVANLYTIINNDGSYEGASDRAMAFVTELNNAGYTVEQIKDINDVMKYYSHIPANIDKFEEMTASGLDADTSLQVQEALSALEPLEGKKQVTDTQKAEAIAGLGLSKEDELKAMSMALSDETYVKYQAVSDYGVDAKTWVDYQNALAEADANNEDESKRNGSYDQEERKAALDSLSVSNDTRAALWQIGDNQLYSTKKDTAWKSARNPYSSSVGAQVVDACVEGKAALSAEEAETASSYSAPLPTGSGSVTSEYGYRTHPISGTWKMHDGVDIAAPAGTEVLSIGAGKVVFSGKNGGYGNQVTVEMEDGTQVFYAHMLSCGVKEGDTVTQGQQIGEVGSTGSSTGNHLHIGAKDADGNSIDPQTIVDLTGEGLKTSTDYTPVVSGGSSSGGGGSSGGGSRSGSSGSSSGNSGSRVASVSSNRSGGSGLTLPSVNTSSEPVGRSTSNPTYGAMGLTLPRVPQRQTSIAYNRQGTSTARTGRTGGAGFWDPNVLS